MKMPSSFRRLCERLSRHWVIRRRLPERFGGTPLYVSPGASLACFRSLNADNWTDLYRFAEYGVGPGSIVWDVGANVGVFAFCAAQRAGPSGRILAIEADAWLAELMKRSAILRRPAAASVAVLCAAVAESVDIQSFELTKYVRSGAHLASSTGAGQEIVGPTLYAQPVVTVTLDWLAERLPPPDTLKIDVEGSEYAVLTGARKLLAIKQPKILLEVYDRNADAVTSLLHQFGYQLYDFGGEGSQPPIVSRAVYQTLALPQTDTPSVSLPLRIDRQDPLFQCG